MLNIFIFNISIPDYENMRRGKRDEGSGVYKKKKNCVCRRDKAIERLWKKGMEASNPDPVCPN